MPRYEGFYPGEQFLDADLPGSQPLIEQFLWEGDHALFIGKEKSGKSIFFLQLVCHLTSAAPLFGTLEIAKPFTVAYCQGEGKLADTQANLRRMRKALDCVPARFAVFYYPALALDTEEGLSHLVKAIEGWQRPDIILSDPLYAFMQGDLIGNQDARRMVAHLRFLSSHFQSTVLTSHHAHRPRRDAKSGAILDEGDDSLFGSFVWKAYPDEVYLFEKPSPKVAEKGRRLSCDTQRMAKSIDLLNLELVDDNALYYQLRLERPGSTAKVLEVFRTSPNGSMTAKELEVQSGYSHRAIWNCLSRLQTEGAITQINPGKKPSLWKIMQSVNTLSQSKNA